MKKILYVCLFIGFIGPPAFAQGGVVGNLNAQTTDCTVSNSCLILKIDPNAGGATIKLSGTFSATVQFEATADPLTVDPSKAVWVAISATPSNSSTPATSSTSAGVWQVNVAGYQRIRIRVSTYASGTVAGAINLSTASARGGSGAGGGGAISSCTTTGGVAFENGTPNTLTCGASLTFDGTTFSDSASTTNTTTSHFGDPASSFTNPNNFFGIFPARNEILSVNAGDNLDTLAVVGQNGAFAAVAAYNYSNVVPPGATQGVAEGSAYDGVTTVNPLLGYTDISSAINGTQLTGDGQETGFLASARFEPHVGDITTGGAAGAASHADFLYGVHSNPVVGSTVSDASTVTTVNAFQSILDFHGATGTTSYMGYEALDAVHVDTATLTTQYGFHAAHMTTGGTNWGFYSDAANNDHFGNIFQAHLLTSTTAPAIAAGGCGGAGASISSNNGTAAFRINIGTSNTGTCSLVMPTATTGWNCQATNLTTKNTNQATVLETSASGASSLVLQNYTDVMGTHAMTDGDTLAVVCMAD